MAYIQKRVHSSGVVTYRARIRMKGAPEMSESFPSKRKAMEWASRMESEIRNGRYFGNEEHKERTFGEFIERYIALELPKNPKSLPKLKMQLRWWNTHLKDYFLCHISSSMISRLKDQLLAEPTTRGDRRAPATANRYLAALSRAFTFAVNEWGWLRENPLRKVSRYREDGARDRFLTKEEISRLLSVCKASKSPHLYPITLLALSSGARKGEIMNLQWNDIDFTRATVTFRNTKNRENRTVSLNNQILDCLFNERNRRLIQSEFVFPSHDGSQPADIRTAWEGAIKEAGLEDICFHILRHTCASHLAMSGASTLEIAAILGHKTLAMVKRYSHLSVSATSRALNRMNDEILGVVLHSA